MILRNEMDDVLFEQGGQLYRERDYQRAFEVFLELGTRGRVEVQVHLGSMYAIGRGTRKDIAKAEHWLRLAADRRVPEAQWRLGALIGSRGRFKEMVDWFKASAAQDYAPAIYRLATCYYSGKGVPRDRAKALQLLNDAREKGNLRAQAVYGRLLATGAQGVFRIWQGVKLWVSAVVSAYKISRKNERDIRVQW